MEMACCLFGDGVISINVSFAVVYVFYTLWGLRSGVIDTWVKGQPLRAGPSPGGVNYFQVKGCACVTGLGP